MPRLSYAILLYQEKETFQNLIDQIYGTPHSFEVRVVLDGDNPEILKLLNEYQQIKPHFHVYQRPLNKDFSAQRNFIASHCQGDYIVRIDADELMPQEFLENTDHYLKMFDQNNYDAIWMPRINFTGAIPEEIIKRDRLQVNEKGWVNFPDMQLKIYKNVPYLSWVNTVHERLIGSKNPYEFPSEEKYAIWHDKPADALISSNQFYRTFRWRHWEKLKKSIEKRLKSRL